MDMPKRKVSLVKLLNQQELIRMKCYQLAKHLNCEISEPNKKGRWEITPLIGVFGPQNIYREVRKDPLYGNWWYVTWEEVYKVLRKYQEDIFFFNFGINESDTEEILSISADGLLQGWIDSGFQDAERLVLCDWLEECGHNRLSELLRKQKK